MSKWRYVPDTANAPYLLKQTEDRTQAGLVNVFGNQPHVVRRLVDDVETEIPLAEVQAGDQLVVSAGEVIPCDGMIVSGEVLEARSTQLADQSVIPIFGVGLVAWAALGPVAAAATLITSVGR